MRSPSSSVGLGGPAAERAAEQTRDDRGRRRTLPAGSTQDTPSISLSIEWITCATAIEGLPHRRPPRTRSPDTAASAARLADVGDVRGGVALEVGRGRDDSLLGPIIQPTRQPGHGVGLGDAVDHDAAIGEFGNDRRHRHELCVAEDEVFVDLVGDHPDALLDRPAADGLDLIGRIHRSGGVRRRHEHQRLGAVGHGPRRDASMPTRNPRRRRVASLDRYTAAQTDRLGIGGPVGRRQQHLVTRVEQRGERVVEGVFAAVGDQHLGRRRPRSPESRCGLDRQWPPAARGARRPACSGATPGSGPPRPPPRRCSRVWGSRARRRRSRSPARRPPSGPWPWRRRRGSPTARWRLTRAEILERCRIHVAILRCPQPPSSNRYRFARSDDPVARLVDR